MQSLDATCDEAERKIKKLKTPNRSTTATTPTSATSTLPLPYQQELWEILENFESEQPSIFNKLEELHKEFSEEDSEAAAAAAAATAAVAGPSNSKGGSTNKGGRLKRSSHLLDKLVSRERLNTLVINLYPGNKGYSLAFRAQPRGLHEDDTATLIETTQWPYEQQELLRHFDNEELPPILHDIVDEHFSWLFYSGCVIGEVRDYRQAYPHFKCNIHHILLRPTQASLLADINNILEEKSDWGLEERYQLESQILLAEKPHLCLDPDPNKTLSHSLTQINRRKQMWSTHRFRKQARKFSQVTVNRKRKLDLLTHRHGLELYDFLTRSRVKQPKNAAMKKQPSSQQQQQQQEEASKPLSAAGCDIGPPSQGVCINEFKTYQRPTETNDCLPQLIEEYVLETDMPAKENGKPRVYHIKLSIFQRPSDSEYLGELYLDRDHKKNERNGVACRFSLGTRANANRYIHQFTDIFTESGRKSVRIRYGISPGYKEKVLAHTQMQPVQNSMQQQINQLSQTLQNQTCVNGGISLIQQNQQALQNSNTTVPNLQSQLQSTTQVKTAQQPVSNQELEINALAIKLMNSAQQFQAAANAKQQQQQQAQQQQQQQQQAQQQQKASSNAAIINLLNSSSTTSNVTNDAVVNAINSTPTVGVGVAAKHQALVGGARKMTISGAQGARVLNHGSLMTINNNRQAQQAQQQPQTITLTSVNSGNFANYTTVPVKQVINQRITAAAAAAANDNKSAISALLVGTAAANRPDIVASTTNSLLLEKLAGASAFQGTTHYIQNPKNNQQFMVQSPKGQQTVLTPLSSPPPQNSNTINVQSLNYAQLQSIPGLQNVQMQLPGFSQPISLSLNVSSTGNLQTHRGSLIVSPSVTTATATVNAQPGASGSSIVGSPTVVLANSSSPNLAQLVTNSVKTIGAQQTLRTGTQQTVTLNPGGQPFQLISAPIQRARPQQQPQQQNQQQRTPITIKMATTNANTGGQLTNQLQKVHLQQYQQLCMNQPDVLENLRRRSSSSDAQ